jgi:tetratricopeptide (TPR) repeat protein
MPIGDKSFIYFPRQELIINFVSGSHSYASETQIINMLKTSLVSYWKGVEAYISSSCQKEVAVDLGWCYNIGHYMWNEMSGLQYLSSNGTLGQVSKFLVGYYEYINIGDTYPEIQPEQIIRWSEPQDGWNLFKTVIDQNYVTVWPTDLIIPEKLANRIYEGAVKRCSPDILQEIEDSKQHFPLIWIAVRSHYRVWLSQIEGIANIINKLYIDYPNLAVVFDGWGRHERHDPRAESEVQREQAIVEKILALIPPDITTYNLIGAMSYERAVWAKATDFYIASYGSGLTFPIWIAGKPGVAHGIVFPELLEKGEWSPFIRENATQSIGLVRDYTDGKSPGYADYDINWQKIYVEVIKLVKETYQSLERLDQAIVAYKPLIDSSHDEALFHYSLAEALAKTGDLELAINHWRQAVDFNPKLENNCFLAHLKGIASFRIHPEDLITTSGKITHKSGIFQLLSLHDNQGIVAYGPYIDLPDGLYKIKVGFEYPELSLYGEEENSETVGFKLDVLTEHNYIWYERNVSTSCQEQIEFFIELVNAHKTEIRFWGAGVSFAINFIEFTLLYQPDRESAEFYYMNQGKHLESKGKLEQAFFAYCCSSQINSQYWQRAISVYQKIGKISPDNTVYAKFYLALNNSQSKSTDLLSEEVRKQINWWEIGDIFARNSLWIEAVQSYQKALQEEPDIATAYQKQVESLATQNELSLLQDTHWKANFFTALLNDPNSVDVYLCLGKLLTAKQRWNEAIYAYRKVLEIVDSVPDINDIYFELGYALAQANQLEAAIKYYQKSLQITPKAYILARIGDVLRRQNKFNEAIEYYEKALQNSLKDYQIYLSLADCLIHNNRLDEASTYLEEIITQGDSRTYQDALVKLADVLEKQGQSEKANTLIPSNQPEPTVEGFYNTTEEWAVATKSTEYREIEPSETQYFPNEYGFISSYSFPKSFVAIVSNGRHCQRDPIRDSYYISPDNKLLLDASLLPYYDISRLDSPPIYLDSPPIYNVEGTVAVISGFSCMTYYHWLVDLLPKLGLISKSEIPLKNIDKFLVPKYSSFHKETLDIMGIPPERILEVSQFPHIKADRLIITPNVCHLRPSSLKFLRDNLMSPVAKLSLEQPERIYISRRLAMGRKFINENEVIEFLARLGFITIDGELLSVAEKISLFSGAKVVVGICGSGLTNLAFCQPGTKVIEIFQPHMSLSQHYYWFCCYLGLEYFLLKAELGLGSSYLRQLLYNGEHTEEAILNIESLKALLISAEIR